MSYATTAALESPLLLLSTNFQVLAASPSYFYAFKASPTAVEGRPLCEADHGRWNLPPVRTLLDEVLAQDRPFAPRTVSYEEPAVGARLRLTAQRPASDGRADSVILLVIEVEASRAHALPAGLA